MTTLPAIELPEHTTDLARQWAYRLGTLPFDSTVEDVALLIQAAMDAAVAQTRDE